MPESSFREGECLLGASVYWKCVVFFFFVQGLILKGLLEFCQRLYLTFVSRVGTTKDCGDGWLIFAET